MSLPTIEPLPDENIPLPPARKRRQRRMIVPPDAGGQASFLRELAQRVVPSFDFFLFSLLAGVVLGLALLADSPALLILAALLAPFMAPVVGISLGTTAGAMRFLAQSLGSLSIGSLIVFLCGTVAGWAVNLLPARTYLQPAFHSHFTWPDFILLVLGAGLTAFLLVRSPSQKPLVTSVAIAYGLYLPAGTAGFGITSGVAGLWPDALFLFLIHLIWAALVGTIVLALLKLYPQNAVGYLLAAIYAIAGIASVAMAAIQPVPPAPAVAEIQPTRSLAAEISADSATVITPSITPSQVSTPTIEPLTATPTKTRTLVPTQTVTMTITPMPTPVWARINAPEGNGALIRDKPSYDGKVVQSLLNGSLVEVLNEVETTGTVAWVHVRTVNGKEGWIVRGLLRTATPAPSW